MNKSETQKKPRPFVVDPNYMCPHCHKVLATNNKGKHCKSRQCTWIRCKCDAIVDIRYQRATHHSHGMACQSDNAPCRLTF